MPDAKERPVLFSGEMVRCLLDDRKTKTRRVIPKRVTDAYLSAVFRSEHTQFPRPNEYDFYIASAPWRVGHRLWVREAWAQTPDSLCLYRGHYRDGSHNDIPTNAIIYRADFCDDEPTTPALKWRPSIHMPRRASRITLEINGVRVERLQDITEEDAKAEGFDVTGWHQSFRDPDNAYGLPSEPPSTAFAELWDSLNAKRGFGWDANPWVYVIEFKRIEK